MRLILLGLPLLLCGCNLFGNPFVGFGGFVSDTITVNRSRNAPPGDGTNISRVKGEEPTSEPLLPEPGNIWPGPPPPEPTLEDIQKLQGTDMPNLPPPELAPMYTPGSSTPPGSVLPNPTVPQSSYTPQRPPLPTKPIQPSTLGTVQTQNGPAVITANPNGVQTYTMPNGVTGRAVPNANGTVTLIAPDGSVQSVPAPR